MCKWQAEITQAILGGRDIVSTAAIGAGKTATFLLPMLFEDLLEFIVMPLKSLGEQMALNTCTLNFTSKSHAICSNKHQRECKRSGA